MTVPRKRAYRPKLTGPRACLYCGKALSLRSGEQKSNFERREYCNTTCANRRRGLPLSPDRLPAPRKIGKQLVYVGPDGRAFVLGKKVNGTVRRDYGEVSACEKCGKDFFHRPTGSARWTNCSRECGRTRLRNTHRSKAVAKGGPKKEALDRTFSLIVRSAGSCFRCGKTDSLQCAHIISRRYLGVRFSLDNALCLCAGCHMYFTYRPLEWEEYITALKGEASFADLKRRAREFVGPLDRASIAQELYKAADERGIDKSTAFKGATWRGIYDPDAHGRAA